MRKKVRFAVLLAGVLAAAAVSGCSKKEVQSKAELADAEVLRGIDYVENGKYEEGVAHFQKALELNPEHPRAWCGMGTVYREKGKFDEAVKHYTKAIELNPKYTVCLDNLGVTYMRMGKTEEALDAFKKAQSTDSGYADVHFNLGELYERTGKIDLAKQEFEKFISLSTKTEKVDEVKRHLEELNKGK